MNFGGEAAFTLAEQRSEEEREAAIAKAHQALKRAGTEECIDCSCLISLARRRVYPSATRCLDCQEIAEKEAYLR